MIGENAIQKSTSDPQIKVGVSKYEKPLMYCMVSRKHCDGQLASGDKAKFGRSVADISPKGSRAVTWLVGVHIP